MAPTPIKPKKDEGMAVGWVTVTYRSVLLSVLALVAVVGMGFYFAFPETSAKMLDSAGNGLSAMMEKMGLLSKH